MKKQNHWFSRWLPGRAQKNFRVKTAHPAGHYYSPIPTVDEVQDYLEHRPHPQPELPEVNMNAVQQLTLLREFAAIYKEVPFQDGPVSGMRYYYNNSWFGYSDAIFLYGMLRKFQPRRIIEVGSGFSSAVILDTVDSCFSQRPEITFIEPYPDRLLGLLHPEDKARVTLLAEKVQEVSPEAFATLAENDLLFIDSSHVLKCRSDLQYLMFEILPRLQVGVLVHFHDVFYPFDYPATWLLKGRHWNENYFLRAFLAWNSAWEIVFFNSYVNLFFADEVASTMPLCSQNHGGGLYLRRTA